MERKDSLVEEVCFYNFISILFEESEKDECLKEKEYDLDKSEETKEIESLSKRYESLKEEGKEKEQVGFETNEELNFFTNQSNSFLVSNFLCVQPFWIQNMENEGSLDYNIYKTISFYPPIPYLCFDHLLKETKLCSFALVCDRIPLQHLFSLISMLGKNQTMGCEDQGGGMGKEFSVNYEDITISLSLNPFLLCHEISFKELKLF